MAEKPEIELTKKYCDRFGKIAVDMKFISKSQLKEAISTQIEEDLANKPHRLLGKILLEKDWITFQQVELVLNELFKRKKKDAPSVDT